MRGRRPKPTGLLVLEKGKLYSDQRDRAELEPKPQKQILPRCPKAFTVEERKAWKYVASILKNFGLFSAAAALFMELLATALAQYWHCCQKMRETKTLFIKGPDGAAVYNPYFRAQHRLGAVVAQYGSTLGLSPTDMARMGSLMLGGQKQKSKMEGLLD